MKILPLLPSPFVCPFAPFIYPFAPFCAIQGGGREGCASSVWRTSVCDWRETRTASAEVTQPEQARQSVSEICAGAGFDAATLSSVVTS
jgi:hypothetical protein